MKKDKRRFTRVPFKVAAKLEAGTVFEVNEIFNLSVGGCLLPVRAVLESGTACIVTIMLSGVSSEMNVRVDGEIVRCGENEVAVKFIRIEPDSLFHLQNIILHNSADTDVIEQEIREHPGLI